MQKINVQMKYSFITNFFLSIIKVVVGFIYSSSALIADGIHSFSDLITDIVSIIGIFLSGKPADQKHPFGHGKLEYLTCLLIGLVVLFLGLGLISSSSKSEIVIPSIVVVIVTLFTIFVKYVLSSYLIKQGIKEKNSILISSGKESKADVISSIVVLISSIMMQYSRYVSILKYADRVASIIVGIFIVKTGFTILKENISMILGEQENDTDILNDMKDMVLKHKEIKNIDKFLVIKNGPYYTITSEVSMNGKINLKKAHTVVDLIEEELKEYSKKVKYINIHINPY